MPPRRFAAAVNRGERDGGSSDTDTLLCSAELCAKENVPLE